MKKVYIYDTFNRFWHWLQALLIFFLGLTGFEIHGSFRLFGFETAVYWHNISAISLILLVVLAIFWHFTSGTWKQYIPTTKNLIAQIRYYTVDIFKNGPHPVKKTVLSKLNPLQKLVYLGLKLLVIPVMVISGLFYMLYRYPQSGEIKSLNIEGLEIIAWVHTAGAFVLLSFVVVHIYLITTGHTLSSNLKAMVTGYEELEDDDENDKNKNKDISDNNLAGELK